MLHNACYHNDVEMVKMILTAKHNDVLLIKTWNTNNLTHFCNYIEYLLQKYIYFKSEEKQKFIHNNILNQKDYNDPF